MGQSLTNTNIKDTYKGLLKTADNAEISAEVQITDGDGNDTGVYLNTDGSVKATGTVSFGELKDSGEDITVTKFVDEADGIGNNDNDTTIPTSAAVKDYVDTNVTAQDLDFQGDSGSGAVDLDSQLLDIAGGTGITTSAADQTLTIDIDSTVATLSDAQTLTNKTIDADDNTVSNLETDNLKAGVLDTDLTSVSASDDTLASAKAIKTYVDDKITAEDLDITDGTTTSAVDLDSQTLTIQGTSNEVEVSLTDQSFTVGLPDTITADVNGDVTGNVTGNLSGNVTGNVTGDVTGDVSGDLTGNVTATSVLADGVTATTQSLGDNSTKVATTAYVDAQVTAEDLDFSGDTGSGSVDLDSQTFAITGTGIASTTASNQGLAVDVPATNLSNTPASTTVDVESSTGNNTTLPAATTTNAGVMTGADKTKLDGIESGAEVNDVTSVNTQTGAVVLDADDIDDSATTNKFTTASDITKLAGIETGADVTDTTNVTTALNSISVTEHNDVTSAGSGEIITSAERTKLSGIEAGAEVNPTSTDELSEGSTNLYYTDSRADARVNLQTGANLDLSQKSTSDLSEGTNLYYTDARVSANSSVTANTAKNSYPTADANKLAGIEAGAEVNPTSTDELSEGSTNLYYTDTRVAANSAVSANTAKNSYPSADATKVGHISVTQAVDLDTMESNIATNNAKNSYPSADATKVGHISVTQAVDLDTIESNVATNNAKISFDSASSTKLAGIETGAQVNTVDSVNGNTGAVSLDTADLTDVSTTAPSDGQVLQYDTTTNKYEPVTLSTTAPVDSVNGQTGAVVLDADDISDASTTNKFATSAEKTKLGHISVTQAADLDTMESNIATNNAKNSYPSADATKVGHISVTQAVDLDTMESNIATNNAKNSYPSGDATKVGFISVTQAVDLDTMESNIATNNAKVSNVTTNLSTTANGTSLTVNSSDGTNASIPAATTSAWGAMTDEDKSKLDGIAAGATNVTNNNQLTNGAGYITDGNTGWNNTYGFITASSSDTLTNKGGNISQWTNDSAYITAASLPTVNNGTLTLSTSAGLDGSASFTANQSGNATFSVSLDLSELTDMTAGVSGANDELILLDSGAERRKRIGEIDLGQFNNDQGWTSNVGDITGVTAGTNLTGGGTSGTVTLNMATGGVGAGTYGSTANDNKIDQITVDAYGRVTAITTGATGAGSMSSWIIKEGNGTETATVTNGETVTIEDGTGIQSELTSTSSGGTITITNTSPNVSTNLSTSTSTTSVTINSSDGTNATIGEATGSAAGVMSTAHHNKLDGIAAGATNVTNNNQLTNGAGYITGYTETDTLSSVTGRGSNTSTGVSFYSNGIICKNNSSVTDGVHGDGFMVAKALYQSKPALYLHGDGFINTARIEYGYANDGIQMKATSNGTFTAIRFYDGVQSTRGSIVVSTSSTTYNTTSDYRLKENVIEITDGIERVKQLQPKRFNFISEPDVVVDGFLAHEAQEVVPESVTGEKDGMQEVLVTPAEYDDEGN